MQSSSGKSFVKTPGENEEVELMAYEATMNKQSSEKELIREKLIIHKLYFTTTAASRRCIWNKNSYAGIWRMHYHSSYCADLDSL